MDSEHTENISTSLEYRVIDYFCSFEYLMSYVGISWPDRTHVCFCPFHENSRSPAAKFFKEDHNEHLFCFAENKLFRPHHLLTNGIVPFTTQHVFSAIWQNLSNSEKSIFSEYTKDYDVGIDFSQYYDSYKKCKLKYFDLLSILKNS